MLKILSNGIKVLKQNLKSTLDLIIYNTHPDYNTKANHHQRYLNDILQTIETYQWCRDPFIWETRGTHLTVTRGTCYQPDHHHPDSLKDTHDDGSPIRTASRKGKWRFNFSYPRKSKRRWQSADIRTTFIMHPLRNTSG